MDSAVPFSGYFRTLLSTGPLARYFKMVKDEEEEEDAIWKSSYSLSSLHSTVRWEVSMAAVGSSVTDKEETWSLLHHVVVVISVDNVGGRQQFLFDGRGRRCDQLHPGLEKVWHIKHLEIEREREGRGCEPYLQYENQMSMRPDLCEQLGTPGSSIYSTWYYDRYHTNKVTTMINLSVGHWQVSFCTRLKSVAT